MTTPTTRTLADPPDRPLAPLALATAAGMVVDRWAAAEVAPGGWLLLFAAALAGRWLLTSVDARGLAARLCLWGAAFAAAAGWHHLSARSRAIDDVSAAADSTSRLARVRGRVAETPVLFRGDGPFWEKSKRTWLGRDATRLTLAVTSLEDAGEWRPASGLLSVRVAAPLPDLTTDAEVEIFGRLRRPDPPANLGSFDY
ncbi:MAG: DUF4131 domain-containing protein, partial [Planctomycetia bacterium]